MIEVARFIKKKNKRLSITRKGLEYLEKNNSEKFNILIDLWLNKLNWAYRYWDSSDIEAMQDYYHVIFFKMGFMWSKKESLKPIEIYQQIENLLPYKEKYFKEHNIQLVIFKFLEYFQLADGISAGKDLFDYIKFKEYKLTRLGKKFFNNTSIRKVTQTTT